jgi:hypothetical protein
MYVRREHSSLQHRCVSHVLKRFKTAGAVLKKSCDGETKNKQTEIAQSVLFSLRN